MSNRSCIMDNLYRLKYTRWLLSCLMLRSEIMDIPSYSKRSAMILGWLVFFTRYSVPGWQKRPLWQGCFFRLWVKHRYGGNSICYDVTSASSCASNLPEAERSYNRDHEDLAQFNLGMFSDEDTGMPDDYIKEL